MRSESERKYLIHEQSTGEINNAINYSLSGDENSGRKWNEFSISQETRSGHISS